MLDDLLSVTWLSLLISNDFVTVAVALMGSTFDLSDGYFNKQNGLHTHFAHHYGDGHGHVVVWCECE